MLRILLPMVGFAHADFDDATAEITHAIVSTVLAIFFLQKVQEPLLAALVPRQNEMLRVQLSSLLAIISEAHEIQNCAACGIEQILDLQKASARKLGVRGIPLTYSSAYKERWLRL